MSYRVEASPLAGRQMRKLTSSVLRRLEGPIRGLAEEPRPSGVRKLEGEDNAWRIRVGRYRVIYEIHDDRQLIVLLQVVRRDEATYR